MSTCTFCLNLLFSDETRLHYIQDAINAAFATYGKRKKPKGATRRGGRTSPEGASGPVKESGAVSSGLASATPGLYQMETYVSNSEINDKIHTSHGSH